LSGQIDLETVSSSVCELGEAPFWCCRDHQLFWIDWSRNRLHRHDIRSHEAHTWEIGERIGSFALRLAGGALLALESGLAFFDFETACTSHLLHPDPLNPAFLLNDGKCDQRGRFIVGSMVAPLAELPADRDKAARGSLFVLDTDLTCRVLHRNILITNGIAWSPDGGRLYFADSGRGAIYCASYDVDTATMGAAEIFAIVSSPGVPDGATVDADGFLWTAVFNGSRLERYAPDGRIDRVIELPVQQPTSCTFGGDGLNTLFVTTARYRLSEAELRQQPLAGRLLALYPKVRGIADSVFLG
jgi:L-arabinonolactonase